jgi:hypothetical protein
MLPSTSAGQFYLHNNKPQKPAIGGFKVKALAANKAPKS